jgi:cytochrome c oxidase subunit 3
LSEARSLVLAHHFDDLAQQREAATLGMWAFLATEVMFFGGAFTAFAVYRTTYPEAFMAASHHLNVFAGTFNTAILLCSSLTVALSVYEAEHNRPRRSAYFILATIGLAVVFLGVKAYEYYEEYQHGLVPGFNFTYRGEHADSVRLFMCFYFVMTAVHATHMLIGIGIFAVVAYNAWKERYSSEYYNPIEISGLYWHFVDLVWIYLFPTLYLLRA